MDKYKILLFSDMHGHRRAVDVAKTIIEKDSFDMAIYMGDFSEKVGDKKSNVEDAEYLIGSLRELAELRVLFGNCDTKEVAELLKEHGVSLHGELIFIGKTAIVGFGGSHPTPFDTPMEFEEDQIRSSLEEVMEKAAEKGAEKLILVTHEAPFETKADEIESGHVGSSALRGIVEKYQPNLHICGHIHEGKSTDFIKETKVINIGPAKDGHFLSVAVDGSIDVEEIDI